MSTADDAKGRERRICPVCQGDRLFRFFEMREAPVLVNFLHETREDAVGCPRGDVVLALCEGCGFISNIAFDASRLAYEEGYHNPLHFSDVFNAYSRGLASDLVEKYGLRGKKVVEVGCGDGTFLELLCEIGGNRGVGFDPSYPEALPAARGRFEVVRDLFSEKYAGVGGDFYCTRHTLEHVPDPETLLVPLRRAMEGKSGAAVYVEVPNVSHTLKNCFVWDIIYEHPSYFTSRALGYAMEASGLAVTATYEAFSGQYVCAEARVGERNGRRPTPQLGEEARREVDEFAARYRTYVEEWKGRMNRWRGEGRKIAVWGTGSKGITFLNVTGAGEIVRCLVDINPNKQGGFVAGSGCEIVSPEELGSLRPDVVVVANPVYRVEVERVLGGIGLSPEVMTL